MKKDILGRSPKAGTDRPANGLFLYILLFLFSCLLIYFGMRYKEFYVSYGWLTLFYSLTATTLYLFYRDVKEYLPKLGIVVIHYLLQISFVVIFVYIITHYR